MEPTNTHNIHAAVAIYRQRYRNYSPCSLQSSSKNVSIFMRDMNKAFAEITGAKVNMGAGYGLEVPCVYRLYGPNFYVDKMELVLRVYYLLMDIIIYVIVTLLNGNWQF